MLLYLTLHSTKQCLKSLTCTLSHTTYIKKTVSVVTACTVLLTYSSLVKLRAYGQAVEEVNIINCHLGNGASVCAIKNGQSVDTSMGLTHS